MLPSNQALWPTENSAVAHCRAMARKLKSSDLCFAGADPGGNVGDASPPPAIFNNALDK